MVAHLDPLLFAFGVARIGLWVAIAAFGYRQRRVLPLAYGGVAALTSTVFAISNAHGHVPGVLTDISTIVALPIVIAILASVHATRSVTPLKHRRGWYL